MLNYFIIPITLTKQCHFKLDVLDKDIQQDSVRAEILGPSGPVPFDFEFSPSSGGKVTIKWLLLRLCKINIIL